MKLNKYQFLQVVYSQYIGVFIPALEPRPITGRQRDSYYTAYARGKAGYFLQMLVTPETEMGYRRGLREFKLTQLLKGNTQTRLQYRNSLKLKR